MPAVRTRPAYRSVGVALLRAAAIPVAGDNARWPDPEDAEACRTWLRHVWSGTTAGAIRHASPSLAARVEAIAAGDVVDDRQVRRAALAVARYVLRARGRPTPFGLFAGVAPVGLGRSATVSWDGPHRPVTRPDAQWLDDVVGRLEACPELLERLEVVANNLDRRRGDRLEVPDGPNRVTIRQTRAVSRALEVAARPVTFGELVARVGEAFPGAEEPVIRRLLVELVREGFLVTALRAPSTVVHPLGHVRDRLRSAGAGDVPAVAPALTALEEIERTLRRHNEEATTGDDQARLRVDLAECMAALSPAGRTALAVDLRLGATVALPTHVADDLAAAADALLHLSRPTPATAAWRDYTTAFVDRYGVGALVPVVDVVDPDTGLGYPAGFPGERPLPPAGDPPERDRRLLAYAWDAVTDGRNEVVLDDRSLAVLSEGGVDGAPIPPHVELAGRIDASSREALDRGDYTVTVSPARSAGTLTSRFTELATGSGLAEAYASLPPGYEGALQVQLSFPPLHPHAENVSRVPAYLPHVLALGEFQDPAAPGVIGLDDLAVTATRHGLHLVSISRGRVVEPQVFHALALDKQPPPLARFLAHLPGAARAPWTGFDWGPAASRLPYLPRVRCGRAVLSPARWQLTSEVVDTTGRDDWRKALDGWRCPPVVELRDDDRTLRLDLDEPLHRALLRSHLRRHGRAVLTEAAPAAGLGWIGGYVHEVAVPLVRHSPPAASPLRGALPVVRNAGHGHVPASPAAGWVYAKVTVHPEHQDQVIADHLPALLVALGDEATCWFVRYASPTERPHLRIRAAVASQDAYAIAAAVVGTWAGRLRVAGLAGPVALDTYHPEVGRYGHGPALAAAHRAFAADSLVVATELRTRATTSIDPMTLAVANMAHVAAAFLGGAKAGWHWLASRPASPGANPDRASARQAAALAAGDITDGIPDPDGGLTRALANRSEALAAYRRALAADADLDLVADSLLHMHHNRAIGIDREGERTCARLIRQVAISFVARAGTDQP